MIQQDTLSPFQRIGRSRMMHKEKNILVGNGERRNMGIRVSLKKILEEIVTYGPMREDNNL
jgi:hypothetical protein